jgi:hypothetical protein
MDERGFWIRFALAVLATWRVTHLLASENGPADLVVRLRTSLGQGLAGKLMDCFQCLSLWIAAPIALYVSRKPLDWCLTWLALSGAACLLERLGGNGAAMEHLAQTAEGDVNDVLRSETVGAAERSHSGAEDAESPARCVKGFIESSAAAPGGGPAATPPGEPSLFGDLANSGPGTRDGPAV